MEVISAYIPADLKEAIDSYIRCDLNRSQIVSKALALWLEQEKNKSFAQVKPSL